MERFRPPFLLSNQIVKDMKIYIVCIDAWDDERQFHEIPNEEIEKMYEKGDSLMVDRYDTIEELAAYWNSDEIFYPSSSYMRVIND